MKTSLLALAFLFVATVPSTRVFAQYLTAIPSTEPASVSVTDIDDDGPLMEPRHVRLGMTPTEVLFAMKGKPDAKLAPDVWVYWSFRVQRSSAEQKFDTLVVVFEQDRVRTYRLVERKAVAALQEQLREQSKARLIAGKK